MKVGISTACLFPMETEVALKKMINFGFDNFEIFVNSDCELSEQFCAKIKGMLVLNEKRAVSIHPYTCEMEGSYFFSDYPRRFDDGIAYYSKYFKMAQIINAEYVIMHGPKKTSRLSLFEFGKRLEKVSLAAKKFGVDILLENVERCLGRNPDVFSFLQKEFPDLGFTCDLKQALRSGYTLDTMISAMGNGIKHVHISDYSPDDDCLPFGDGLLDTSNLIQLLQQEKFAGTLVLELYGNKIDNKDALVKSIERMNKLLGDQL